MNLDKLGAAIHKWARSKGFYKHEYIEFNYPTEGRVLNPSLPSEKLMLIVTEVSETLEALRDDNRELEAEEVADILIRTLDYAAWRGISLDKEVPAKMAKNEMRPYLHARTF